MLAFAHLGVEPVMKRIVILCDGTWNAAEAVWPTNVVRLAQALAPTGADGMAQVPIYVEGVGTGRRGVTRLARLQDRLLGGLLGLGLMDNVAEAYRHLVFLHEPGDQAFVFGFSRGAFTARSLAGFLRFTGLLARADLALLPEAVARYGERRDESCDARQARNAAWRARHSPHVMTDPADAPAYAAAGADQAIPFEIDYMGVWDTVGALGVPGLFTAKPVLSRRHAFHDTTLSTMVRAARHAVALDERRRPYMPTTWSNLPVLEAQAAAEGRGRPYRQEHFAGDHAAVGGGGDRMALSALTLLWVMEGAEAAGLEFDERVRARIAAQGDPLGPLEGQSEPARGPIPALLRLTATDRPDVTRLVDVSRAARRRWAADPVAGERYRPAPLALLEGELRAWAQAQAREVAPAPEPAPEPAPQPDLVT